MARRKRTEAVDMSEILDQEIGTEQAETIEVEHEHEGEQEDGVIRCRVCGRLLTAEQSVIRGIGPLCAERVNRALAAMGYSLVAKEGEEGYADEAKVDEAVGTVKAGGSRYLTKEEFEPISEEYVKLSDVDKALKAEGRSIAAFVKAFGGDRGLEEPLNEHWQPVYVGRVRYLPKSVMQRLDEIPLTRTRTRLDGAAAKPGNENLEAEVVEATEPAEAEGERELVEAGS